MSGEFQQQGDPWLQAALESAQLDEPPAGAEERVLAALSAAAGATALASQAPIATGLAKATPVAAKIASVLGVVGLGAVLLTQHAASTTGQGVREPSRLLVKHEPTLVTAPSVLASPLSRTEAPEPRRVVPIRPHDVATEEAPEAPSPSSLELETKLLGAARRALATGDRADGAHVPRPVRPRSPGRPLGARSRDLARRRALTDFEIDRARRVHRTVTSSRYLHTARMHCTSARRKATLEASCSDSTELSWRRCSPRAPA